MLKAKVLIVSLWEISNDCVGGTERYVIDLSSQLHLQGVDVDVLMLSGEKITLNGVKYTPVKGFEKKVNEYMIKKEFFSILTEQNLKNFANCISKNCDVKKYDLIHMNSLLFYFLFPEKKRVFAIHDNPSDFDNNWGTGSFKRFLKIVNKNKFKKTFFVAPSKIHGEEIASLLHEKILVIPHALNLKDLVSKRAKAEIRAQYGIGDSYTILIPSRLELFQKGQDLAARALCKASSSLGKFQVIFSGLDPQYEKNVKLIKSICKNGNFKYYFIKFSNIGDAYRLADLVIVPSRSEIFGYSALESLALGKKTVLSDIPTFREFSINNPSAYISKLDPMTLSKSIIRAFQSKDKKTPSGWFDKYEPRSWAKNYIKFYEKIISK